jgi:divalent metal cation (Fe/Co/Zn/Cd) transporter
LNQCSVTGIPADNLKTTVRTAKNLALFTVIYNLIEGFVSIYFGVAEESISLLGFGLDSFIEVSSAAIVLVKLGHNDPDANLKHERRATFLIGILFLLLAISILLNSGFELFTQGHPETTVPGIVISLLSLSFMFFLWKEKVRVGKKLDSSTVMADAQCSLACIKLSLILFLGSVIYWALPVLWWIDSAAAIILSFFIFREGKELISNSRKEDFKGGCGCH